MTVSTLNIALAGCGKMGSALLDGWLKSKIENRIHVLDPVGLPERFSDFSPNPVMYYRDSDTFLSEVKNTDLDVLVMAVKPQIMNKVCSSLASGLSRQTVLLSIAAGQPIALFERHFGLEQPIVRAMPNTPASIGQGISVAVPNAHVSGEQKIQATAILESVGQVEWIEDEGLLNAVTAVSGSGPAYVFLLTEAMAQAGEKMGLEKNFAMKLARQTVIGSAALAKQQNDIPAAQLRENVTSPGGTTAAALNILMRDQDGLFSLMDKAIEAATKRGQELASS